MFVDNEVHEQKRRSIEVEMAKPRNQTRGGRHIWRQRNHENVSRGEHVYVERWSGDDAHAGGEFDDYTLRPIRLKLSYNYP